MSNLLSDVSTSLKEGHIESIETDDRRNVTVVTLVVPEWSTKVWQRVQKMLDKAYHARTGMWRQLKDVRMSFIPTLFRSK